MIPGAFRNLIENASALAKISTIYLDKQKSLGTSNLVEITWQAGDLGDFSDKTTVFAIAGFAQILSAEPFSLVLDSPLQSVFLLEISLSLLIQETQKPLLFDLLLI